jgi:sulfonate transport system ATP-binding protein
MTATRTMSATQTISAINETLSPSYAERRARDMSEPVPQRPVAVRLRGVAKCFGALTVLRGIDLDIPSGQFVAIVGRSGCGKSTLLRLLAGLEAPSAGHIGVGDDDGAFSENDTVHGDDTFGGHATNAGAGPTGKNRAPNEHVRLMFQEPRLLPWARVARNVEVGLTRAEDRRARRRLAREALARVGLAERADDWPAVLSGGQKQRVALARALVSRPWLLALDEPLGALDALTRIGMQELIEDVWRAQRFTAVLVTHDVTEAVTLADRMLVLEDGRITADIAVDLPRPRHHGDADLARIEGRVLDHLLGRHRLTEEST